MRRTSQSVSTGTLSTSPLGSAWTAHDGRSMRLPHATDGGSGQSCIWIPLWDTSPISAASKAANPTIGLVSFTASDGVAQAASGAGVSGLRRPRVACDVHSAATDTGANVVTGTGLFGMCKMLLDSLTFMCAAGVAWKIDALKVDVIHGHCVGEPVDTWFHLYRGAVDVPATAVLWEKRQHGTGVRVGLTPTALAAWQAFPRGASNLSEATHGLLRDLTNEASVSDWAGSDCPET